jgi:hypothetical protein
MVCFLALVLEGEMEGKERRFGMNTGSNVTD